MKTFFGFERKAWHIDFLGGVFIIAVTLGAIWINNNRPGTHETADVIMERQSDVDAAGKAIRKFVVCADGTTAQNGKCPEGQGI
jgi:hypothetical protein